MGVDIIATIDELRTAAKRLLIALDKLDEGSLEPGFRGWENGNGEPCGDEVQDAREALELLVRYNCNMRIIQANLCLRFLPRLGWTREAVRQMLRGDKRLARVMPRYYDERDSAGKGSFELDDKLPHDDCEYFAVYGSTDPFLTEALAAHEIV